MYLAGAIESGEGVVIIPSSVKRREQQTAPAMSATDVGNLADGKFRGFDSTNTANQI